MRDVAITPDDKFAISCSDDRTLGLWDMQTGIELATLVGHDDWVMTVAITPEGKWAVSGSGDRFSQNQHPRDLESGEIASFTDERELETCAVAPDGVTIVAGEASERLHFMRFEEMNGK